MPHETPAQQIDREMHRLHDLAQHMVYWIGSIQRTLDRDHNLARPPAEFFQDVCNLHGAFELALPLAKKHRQRLADLRQGRTVTVAGITAPSQTEAIVIHAARMLRHIAGCIPDELSARNISIAGTGECMDPTEN